MLNKKFNIFTIALLLLTITMISFYLFQPASPYWEKMKKKKPGPDQRPAEWLWEQRTFPHNNFNLKSYHESLQNARVFKKNAKNNKVNEVTYAGPSNIGGRITDIEFNPLDPNIVYAGAASGGVFKSTDMGTTWFPVFDDQAILNIGDIGIDPIHPDTIYVGTGEANGGSRNFPGAGVYKSVNGGQDWEFSGLENSVSIGRVVVNPTNSEQVFVAAVGSYFSPNEERGIFRSDNGGQDWENVLFISDTTGAIDIIMDPQNPSNLMAAMWERVRHPNYSRLSGHTSGIYQSNDGGDEWEYLGPLNGLPDPTTTEVGRIGLALCNSQPNIVYALYNDGRYYTGLYRSNDFGNSWSQVDPNDQISEGTLYFSWYFGQVRVHPTNPNIVFAMDVAFMKSTDGGNTWPIIYGYGGPENLHVDHHALAIHPDNPEILINGNDGGINVSTNGGNSFTKVADLPVNQFYEIELDANNPQKLYGGTQDNGTLRTQTGQTNDWERIWGGDGFYVLVDFNCPDTIYAESQFGNLVRSFDGGVYWGDCLDGIGAEPTNWSTPVVMDPQNNHVLYYGTDRVYKTENCASFWFSISDDLTDGIPGTRLGTVTTIGVSPAGSNIIWAGTDDSHVWVTEDFGGSWTDVSSTLPTRWVTRVIPDPVNPAKAYVTFSGLQWVDPQPHVFVTTNYGADWTDISANLPDAPVNALAVDPLNTDHIFIGTDLGAYYSLNGGENWEYISDGLPMIPVFDMKVHPTDRYLAIGTYGRSMYKFELDQLVSIDDQDISGITEGFQLKQNYPNPFNPSTTISFSIPKTSEVNIEIFNTLGEKVEILVSKSYSAGPHQVTWNAANHPSGTYFYKITAGNFTDSKKMVLVK